jgi:SnoaL-like domain
MGAREGEQPTLCPRGAPPGLWSFSQRRRGGRATFGGMKNFEGLDADDARRFSELWLPAWTGNRPEYLASFYTEDAFYSDPGLPVGGVRGRRALLSYFTRLLRRFPDWTWSQRGSQPLKDGFLNGWHACIPVGQRVIEIDGVCSVQLRNGLIYRNVVYFDRSELLRALEPRPRISWWRREARPRL